MKRAHVAVWLGLAFASRAPAWSADDVRARIVDGTLTRERACDGKARFANSEHAEKARNDIEARHKEPNSLVSYPCPFCGGWHFARNREL